MPRVQLTGSHSGRCGVLQYLLLPRYLPTDQRRYLPGSYHLGLRVGPSSLAAYAPR
jgi:hypothetical protein